MDSGQTVALGLPPLRRACERGRIKQGKRQAKPAVRRPNRQSSTHDCGNLYVQYGYLQLQQGPGHPQRQPPLKPECYRTTIACHQPTFPVDAHNREAALLAKRIEYTRRLHIVKLANKHTSTLNPLRWSVEHGHASLYCCSIADTRAQN